MYLKRYHEIKVSKSGVWRILKRLDLGRLPASQRYKRHDRNGSATRSRCPATGPGRREVRRADRRHGARSTTSSPPSTTAPG